MSRRLLGVLRQSLPISPITVRHASTSTTSTLNTNSASPRIARLLTRTPRFLHPYVRPLLNAPISHITTFLLLHELTAVVPLIGLSLYFHYTNTLPTLSESKYVSQGVETFSRYFRRKGWFGLEKESGEEWREETSKLEMEIEGGEGVQSKEMSPGMKVVLEVATAYAITKVFLPARLLLSVWATPGTARVGLRALGALGMRKPATRKAMSTANTATKLQSGNKGMSAGTGATAGGVVGRS